MGILTAIKSYLNIIIGVLIAGITFYLASLYYNHKIDNINKDFTNYKTTTEKNILEQKNSILAQNNEIQKENLDLNNKLKEVEDEKFKQSQDLQKANDDLKLAVANNTKRLYIHATCPKPTNNTDSKTETAKSPSLDDGSTSKAVIDSGDATAIITITNKADKYKSQLEALQEWVNNLITENNK